MVSWAVINTFGLPIGIWLLRNGVGYYSSIKQSYARRSPQMRDTPPRISRALTLLFVTALAFLIYTLPYFAPPNIFKQTNGRLQTANDVLFTRLAAIPGHGPLSTAETALKAKINSATARLIYLTMGPAVITNCPFCTTKEPTTYIIYALPILALPHLIHLAVLGLVTSHTLTGPHGARWRHTALISGLFLAALDLYLLATHDMHKTLAATRTSEIDAYHWRARTARGLAIAALDALLAALLYLSATARFFPLPVSPADRLRAAAAALDAANFRLWAAGNVRNAVVRDQRLRRVGVRYWTEEMGIFEEREVVAALQSALRRVDMRELQDVAGKRAGDVLDGLDVVPSLAKRSGG